MNNHEPPRLLIIGQGIDGGIAPLVSLLARGLQKKGWSCAVRYVGRPTLSTCVVKDQQEGVDSQAIVTGQARSVGEICGLIMSVWPLWRVMRQQNPDVVIFAGFMPALLYPLFLRPFSKARFVFWDHAPQNTFLKIKQVLFPFILTSFDKIISISSSTAAALCDYFNVAPDHITMIPNGVGVEPWVSIPAVTDFSNLRVLMPARFDLNQKDQVTLIRAAALLHARGVKILVTLVGAGIDEERIREAIMSADATDFVHLLAHSDDVPSLMARHNVVCLSTKFEGMPTVVIEAMLARRVVVASRVAGCVDIIRDGENGWLFDAGSADDCAARLASLQTLGSVEVVVERACREARERYASQAMIEKFEQVLWPEFRGGK